MRKRKSPVFALAMVLVLILLSLPMAAGAAPQPDVVVTIAVDQEAFAADQNVGGARHHDQREQPSGQGAEVVHADRRG